MAVTSAPAGPVRVAAAAGATTATEAGAAGTVAASVGGTLGAAESPAPPGPPDAMGTPWKVRESRSSWEEMSSIERVSGEARPSRGVEKSCSGLAADTWDEGEMSHT